MDLRATNDDKVWADCEELPVLGVIRSAKEMKDGRKQSSEQAKRCETGSPRIPFD